MRTREEIQTEYIQQCSIAGDTNYKIYALQKDLYKMNQKLKELNKEAMRLQEAQAASEVAKAAQTHAVPTDAEVTGG